MTDPLPVADLAERWARTLGEGADWGRVDPQITQKPTQAEGGTLSGVATLCQSLSGGRTHAGTLSGGATVGPAGGGELGGSAAAERAQAFDIVGEVGRGGMGVVYRARQRSLARDIALKFIRPEQADAGARERFVSEALVNGLLDHPNIVPVHELGTDPGGEVYLAMKLVGGRSWKALLHPSSAEERAAAATYDIDRHLGVLQGVCNAIAFAHSRGIVHRDLKPENVMVGEFGEILVMDWGIAVDIRDAPDGDQRAQHRSTVTAPSGTPSYMAPELAEGRGRDIGPWTDVYLLGAMLHEVLTGHPPHRGRTLMEVLLAASRSVPPSYDGTVQAGLGAIARRALARSPDERYPTVAAFQSALTQWLGHRASQQISERADGELASLETAATSGPGRYAVHAKVLARYEQAIELWPGNAAAAVGLVRGRVAYARAAIAGGDLGLAEGQAAALPVGAAESDAVRAEVAAMRTARARARLAAKRTRMAVMALAVASVLIVVGASIVFLVQNERDLRHAGQASSTSRVRAGALSAWVARGVYAPPRDAAAEAVRRLTPPGATADMSADQQVRDLLAPTLRTQLLGWRVLAASDGALLVADAQEAALVRPDEDDAVTQRLAASAPTLVAAGSDGRSLVVVDRDLVRISVRGQPGRSFALPSAATLAATDPRLRWLALYDGERLAVYALADGSVRSAPVAVRAEAVALDDAVMAIAWREGDGARISTVPLPIP